MGSLKKQCISRGNKSNSIGKAVWKHFILGYMDIDSLNTMLVTMQNFWNNADVEYLYQRDFKIMIGNFGIKNIENVQQLYSNDYHWNCKNLQMILSSNGYRTIVFATRTEVDVINAYIQCIPIESTYNDPCYANYTNTWLNVWKSIPQMLYEDMINHGTSRTRIFLVDKEKILDIIRRHSQCLELSPYLWKTSLYQIGHLFVLMSIPNS